MKTKSGQVQYKLYPPRWQVALMKKNQKIILLKFSGQIYPLDVLLISESTLKQEALTAVVHLACLEIRLRNEEVINST